MTNVQENLGRATDSPQPHENGRHFGVLGRCAGSCGKLIGCLSHPRRPQFCCNCFLKGTKIRTAEGERRIEDLAIGDLLPTMFGGLRPIQWIARYPIKKSDPSKPWVKDVLPVRISRSALAPDVPHADLYVTGGHSLFIDGLLVRVGDLINGTSIVRDERDYDELEFFHIKLESHDVVYAEGAPVDTLLNVNEGAVNFAEYFRRYGTPERPGDALRSARHLRRRTRRIQVKDSQRDVALA